jgi:methyl-accepting chemotaxis protein
VPALSDWGEINGYMGNMRTTFTKLVFTPFDPANEQAASDLNGKIAVILDQAKQGIDTPQEDALVNKAISAYQNYFKDIPAVIAERKKEVTTDPGFLKKIIQNGNVLTASITENVNYQKQLAADSGTAAKKAYNTSISLFITIFVISVIILSLISILVVYVIRSSIKEFMGKLKTISQGDFRVQFDTKSTNEFGQMNKALGITVGSISGILKTIENESTVLSGHTSSLNTISSEMSNAIGEVASAINEVAEGSSSQAQELTTVNDSFQTLADRLDQISESVHTVDENVRVINHKAETSNTQLIEQVTASVNRITEITEFIESIADQTNLLSLNASIEAARAGDAGRGFAVVAEEIRKLAEESKKSSESITEVLSVIKNVNQSAINAFKDIIDSIGAIMPQLHGMTTSMTAVNDDKNAILAASESTSAVAQQNSASSQEISASSEELTSSSHEVANSINELDKLAQRLMKEVARFKLAS